MIAIDTNVIVRFVVNDDAEQAKRARALIEREPVFVSVSVLLETEWVLRGLFGLPRVEIVATLRDFLALPQVSMERPEIAAAALDRAMGGMDLADAIHLASGEHCEAFATFDRKFARLAANLNAMPVQSP